MRLFPCALRNLHRQTGCEMDGFVESTMKSARQTGCMRLKTSMYSVSEETIKSLEQQLFLFSLFHVFSAPYPTRSNPL